MSNLAPTWLALDRLLSQEQFEEGFKLLEHAYSKANQKDRSTLILWGVHVHSLYGEVQVKEGLSLLHTLGELDPPYTQNPLFKAIETELLSYLLNHPTDFAHVKKTGEELLETLLPLFAEENALVHYHATVALTLLDNPKALLSWQQLDWPHLPTHLQWRYFTWLGTSYTQADELEEALNAFDKALQNSPFTHHVALLCEKAAVAISLTQFELSEQLLTQAFELLPKSPYLEPQWHYLKAQSQMGLRNPETALTHIERADQLEAEQHQELYATKLLHGQIWVHLSEPIKAIPYFQRASEIAEPTDRAFALHELGVACLDADQVIEAREQLQRALETPDYPFFAEVHADLAECEYRLGKAHEAEVLANQALEMGAIVTASLVLGTIAMDYYHLEEALEHYARAIDATTPESGHEWVLGHQMSADILVQLGFKEPARILFHAEQALQHMDGADEWQHTLKNYAEKAREMLSDKPNKRTLN